MVEPGAVWLDPKRHRGGARPRIRPHRQPARRPKRHLAGHPGPGDERHGGLPGGRQQWPWPGQCHHRRQFAGRTQPQCGHRLFGRHGHQVRHLQLHRLHLQRQRRIEPGLFTHGDGCQHQQSGAHVRRNQADRLRQLRHRQTGQLRPERGCDSNNCPAELFADRRHPAPRHDAANQRHSGRYPHHTRHLPVHPGRQRQQGRCNADLHHRGERRHPQPAPRTVLGHRGW